MPRPRSLIGLAALLLGCEAGDGPFEQAGGPLVYGADDRVEYFALDSGDLRARMSQSLVALVPKRFLRQTGERVVIEAPTWGEAGGLCPGERFADQPAAAFCTGVLADWDLVLTAGHCLRVLALGEIAVVFDYLYAAPGEMEVAAADVMTPIAIPDEALDPAGSDPRLDYGWLRLDRFASPPHRPAPLHVRRAAIEPGDPLIAMGAGGGVPMKVDRGGTVHDAREASDDYFVADTDTSKGSSGGGAFDGGLALLGVLARGGADLVGTEAGCNVVIHQDDGELVEEQYTHAHRAVEGLCRQGEAASSLCRSDCGDPCEALPKLEAGCSVGGGVRSYAAVLLVVALGIARRRRGVHATRAALTRKWAREELERLARPRAAT